MSRTVQSLQIGHPSLHGFPMRQLEKKKKKRKNAPRIGDYRQSRRQGGTKGGEGEGETLTLFIMCFISTLVCVGVIYTQIRSTQTVDTPTDDCEIHVL